MDLVERCLHGAHLPVGRLDKNSLGLLLFTNDGDLTKQLTHPSYLKRKNLPGDARQAWRVPIWIASPRASRSNGEIFADEISYVKENKQEIGIEIHSGRNRIVRRIFEFLATRSPSSTGSTMPA